MFLVATPGFRSRLNGLEFHDSVIVRTQDANLTLPGTIQEGDVCVYHERRFGNTPTVVSPSGFDLVGSTRSGNSDILSIFSIKLLDGSETNIPKDSTGSVAYTDRTALIFRGTNKAVQAIDVNTSYQGQSSTAQPTNQTQTISGKSNPVIVIGGHVAMSGSAVADAPITTRTMSPNRTGEIQNTHDAFLDSIYISYVIYSSSPQNTTVGMSDTTLAQAHNILSSFYIECT